MKGALFFSAAAAVAGSALAHVGHQQHNAFHQRRAYEPAPMPSDSTYEAEPAPSTTGYEASPIPSVSSYVTSPLPNTTGYEATPIPSDSPSDDEDCGCITKVITYYGEPSLVEEKTTTIKSTSTTTKTISVTPEPELPTPVVTVFPTPGTYTIPETTIVVTKETTVCAATSTALPPGEHTYGGVTTVVTTATTVTCDIAVTKPVGSAITSVIEQTTYVCPTPGTYTIAPSTTSVPASTIFVFPTPATYTTGTYTQPAQTVTVTETNYVYVCPPPTNFPQPPPTSKPPPPPKKPQNPDPKPPVLGGGDKWGMTYSPFTDSGECKGQVAVAADIALIKLKGFKTVRVYGTECDGLRNIGNACKINGLKMILGVFVSEKGMEDARKQVQDIVNWGNFGMVDLIVVGNEALHQHTATVGSLIELLKYSRGAFRGAGYNGPITTTEPLNKWQEFGKSFCPYIDVIGANIHCYFNPNIVASQCGSFVKGQMEILAGICDRKEVINLETGWPSGDSNNKEPRANKQAQAEAIKSIIKEVGSKSVFFSFTNDLWKLPGALGVEQFWGCGDLF